MGHKKNKNLLRQRIFPLVFSSLSSPTSQNINSILSCRFLADFWREEMVPNSADSVMLLLDYFPYSALVEIQTLLAGNPQREMSNKCNELISFFSGLVKTYGCKKKFFCPLCLKKHDLVASIFELEDKKRAFSCRGSISGWSIQTRSRNLFPKVPTLQTAGGQTPHCWALSTAQSGPCGRSAPGQGYPTWNHFHCDSKRNTVFQNQPDLFTHCWLKSIISWKGVWKLWKLLAESF